MAPIPIIIDPNSSRSFLEKHVIWIETMTESLEIHEIDQLYQVIGDITNEAFRQSAHLHNKIIEANERWLQIVLKYHSDNGFPELLVTYSSPF